MNKLINWPEFRDTFKYIYPRTIRDCLDNDLIASVLYLGHCFEIRPVKAGTDFEVWGPDYDSLINYDGPKVIPLFPSFTPNQ